MFVNLCLDGIWSCDVKGVDFFVMRFFVIKYVKGFDYL